MPFADGSFDGVIVQAVGQEGREYQIRVPMTGEEHSDKNSLEIQAGLNQRFGEGKIRPERVAPESAQQCHTLYAEDILFC